MSKKRTTLLVQDTEVSLYRQGSEEYISLTDIAKRFGNSKDIIQNWLRNRSTLEFLGVWEELHNEKFKRVDFDAFLYEAGSNTFHMSPKRWIEGTDAIGITSKPGRGGGTYAHKDIAFGFCYWVSPPFQLYIIKEFQRLKEDEAKRLSLDWSVKRILAKANYRIQTEAIREYLIPPRIAGTKREGGYYATEADLLNVALFGMTAKDWRLSNPEAKGNIRDYATAEQLLVLANLESINAELIKLAVPQEDRLDKLNEIAIEQMSILLNTPPVKELKGKDKKEIK